MLALPIALLRQAHGGHERPGRMAMAINAERGLRVAAAEPPAPAVQEALLGARESYRRVAESSD